MEDVPIMFTELPDSRLAVTTLRSKSDYHHHPYFHRLHQPHLHVQRVPSPQPALERLTPEAYHQYSFRHLHHHHQHRQHQQQQFFKRQEEEQEQQQTHVTCLYPEILALIFSYLNVADKGRAAQVCTTWRDSAYQKSVWRGVEAKLHLRRTNPSLFNSLVWRGIKRVQVLSFKKSLREVVVGLPALQSLNLSGCYDVTDVGLAHVFAAEISTLTELNLSFCKQVTDTSLGRIAQHVKHLEVLRLNGCSLVTDTGLLLIAWGLKRLRRLDLRSCWHLSDQGIAHLAGLKRETAEGNLDLEYLGLQDCQRLTDDALKHISTGLKNLRSVNLSFCVGISDSGLKYLAKMLTLQELNLRSCDNITDIGMCYLSEGGSKVSSLDVSFCDKITDAGLQFISQGLYGLRCLSLSACPITDEGVARIARMLSDLETLNVGQCRNLTDQGLFDVAENMHNLQYIDLYGCTGITRVGQKILARLPNLAVNLGLGLVR